MNDATLAEQQSKAAESTRERLWAECPLCTATTSKSWVAFAQVEFVRCVECDVVFKSREIETIRETDFYEQDYFKGRKSAREKKWERRVRKAKGQLIAAQGFSSGGGVLDIGCSLGYGVEAGRRLGIDAAGTDISEFAVKACRQRGLRAEVATLEELPFKDGEFGVVTMRHVLEHTPQPKVALAEVRRVLSSGGVTLIAVPNLAYWKGLFRRRQYRYFRPDDLGQQHYVYYTVATLSRLLEANGFEVVATSKAVLRRNVARQSPLHMIGEAARFAFMATWQALARALLMRRELTLIARRK